MSGDFLGPLTRGLETFTLERLICMVKESRWVLEPGVNEHSPPAFLCEAFRLECPEGARFRSLTESQRAARIDKICHSLFEQVTLAPASVGRLDDILSPLIQFSLQFSEELEEISNLASHLLEGLPAWPLELNRIPDGIPAEYFVQTTSDAELWKRLKVVNYVSNNVLRVALTVLVLPKWEKNLKNFINNLAELFDSASGFGESSWRWFIVKAFLWTSWQRCQIIFFKSPRYREDDILDPSWFNLRVPGRVGPEGLTQESSKECGSLGKSAYMCGWAFKLLRRHPICIGADFRRFHQRYNATFGTYNARCLAQSSRSCSGDNPSICQRFESMTIETNLHTLSRAHSIVNDWCGTSNRIEVLPGQERYSQKRDSLLEIS